MKITIRDVEYQVRFRHDPPDLFERETVCDFFDGEKLRYTGWAVCVEGDNFKRSTGRCIALTRAIANLPREDRREVWKQYGQQIGNPVYGAVFNGAILFGSKMKTIYDPPSGWMHGFPRQYLPLDGESLKDTLIRDGYPQKDAEWASHHTRFWEDFSEFCVYCGAGIGKFRRQGEGTCPKCETPGDKMQKAFEATPQQLGEAAVKQAENNK